MTALNTLEKWVRPFVGRCPVGLIHRALLSSARLFFEKTRIWQEDIAFTTVVGQSNYTLAIDPSQTAMEVVWVKWASEEKWLGYAGTKEALDTYDDEPMYFAVGVLPDIHLGPVPDAAIDLVAKVSVKPTLSAVAIRDDLAEAWGEAIANSACMDLLMMQGMEWYNPQQAGFHEAKFVDRINDARTLKNTGQTSANLRVPQVPFI